MMKIDNILLALAFAALAVGCASTSTKPVVPAVQSAAPQKASPAAVVAAQTASAPVASKPAVPATTTKVVLVDPSGLKSLQPFAKFADGTGYGFAREYKSRDKAQFVALMRSKNGLRVSCDVLVHQMVEAHPGLPFEGCEGAAAEIERNSDFMVVACEDQMFIKDNWLTVTNEQGSTFGVWHRKCLAKEQVLVYNKKSEKPLILASTTCANTPFPVSRTEIVAAASASKSAAAPTAPGSCPNGYTFTANAWSLQEIEKKSPKLYAEALALIAAAEARNTQNVTLLAGYTARDFSNGLGYPLRTEIKDRTRWTGTLRVQLRHPETLALEQELVELRVTDGVGSITLNEAQKNRIVETIWPTANFVYPTISGGARRLMTKPDEWGARCGMNVHGAK